MEQERPLILCVCHGNIARSPIMEHMLRRAFEDCGIGKGIRVRSAGIMGTGGEREPSYAGPPHVRVRNPLARYPVWERIAPLLSARAIDFSGHMFHPITREDVECADAIYAADRNVLLLAPNALARQFPDASEKMALFTSLAGRAEDIPDFGEDGTLDACVETVRYIEECIRPGIETIRKRFGV